MADALFSLYIDKISDYIERFSGFGSCLASISIWLIVYADDILLIDDDL